MGKIDEWFFNSLVGISPDVKHVDTRSSESRPPKPVGDLNTCSHLMKPLYGKITVDWTRENGRFKLKLSVPVNTVAVVTLPGRERTERGGERET